MRLSTAYALCGALAFAIAPASAAAQSCAEPGFPLAVSAPFLPNPDSAFLGQTARALAYGWPVPSKRRDTFVSWRRVRRRTLPPEPRWADDWTPPDSFRTQFRVIIKRRGRPRVDLKSIHTGDELVDQSLRLMVEDRLPASPDFPPFPDGVEGDSLVLDIYLGAVPDTVRAETIRFAVRQRRVEVFPGTLEFSAPREPMLPPSTQRYATIKYDVNELGEVVASTIEVLDSSDRPLVEAARSALLRARFRPAEQGCRPITMSVVQSFRG